MQSNLPPISEIWVYLSGSPLLALVLTLSAYLLGLMLYERSDRNPLANPVLIAVILVTLSINVLDMPYAKYFEGAQFVHFLLGTATSDGCVEHQLQTAGRVPAKNVQS